VGRSIDVELRDVTKQFDDVIAVDHASLQIERGEFFSLLGPSGCGKTTTLRMIAGFEHPTSGEVFIQGRPMGATPPFQRNVNTVFQNYALFPHMTVAENIAFGLEMKRVPKPERQRRVDAALRQVRLEGYGERRPLQLSGGQQQRVALARALINQPGVLLLDEPLGALDLKLRKEMQLELKHLQTSVGITFIYVTHDQEEALTMSDRIAVMNEGKVLQIGTPEEIYERPNCRFVADFIGESNFLEGRVTEVAPDRVVVVVDDSFPVVAPGGPAVSPGEWVTLAVRPEKIHVQPGSGQVGVNGHHGGRVEEVVYIGTDTYYLVRLSDRVTVRARLQNRGVGGDGHGGLAHGAEVAVSWAPEHTLVLTS